ncbi:MAG: hypothetical protein ACKVXR_00290, partial [Planctomycetota bacterium]
TGARARSEERATGLESERASLQAEIERQSDHAGRLAGDGRALDERRAHLATRVALLEKDAREEDERARRLDEAQKERAAELARLETELAALATEVACEEKTEAERASALLETERAAADRRSQHETARAQGLEILAEMNRAENRARSLGEALERAWARAERAREELEASLAAEKALKEEVAALEGEAQRSETERAERDEARRRLEREIAQLADEVQKADQERGTLEVERARAASRIEFLLDRERDLEELSQAARTLLGGAGDSPCAPEDLCGLVADHLRTDTEHARALDAALAARGRAIVARNREAARAVATWLKARETGQIGLLLGAGLSSTPRPLAPAPEGADAELVRGRLLEHVRCTEGCERLAEILVGDVFVARDLDAAIALAGVRPDLRFVTLEGDLADAAGVLGGSGALAQGAVGRRSSAAELRLDLERISARIGALEAARAALAERQSVLAESRKDAGMRLEEALAARTEAESRLATARARHEDVDLDRPALENESEVATLDVAQLEADLAAENLRRDEARSRHEAARLSLAELERALREGEIARETAAKSAAEARIAAARARERLEGLTTRRGDQAGVLRENQEEMQRARRLSAEHAESARTIRAESEVAALESARVLEERGRVEERLRELRAREEAGRAALAAARSSIDAQLRDIDAAQSALSETRLGEQRLSLSRLEILRRAAEELGLDEGALSKDFTPEAGLEDEAALAALAATVQEQKERLDKLGPVNMEAMAELTEVGGRLDFLASQRADLSRAREALGSTLQTIDVESKRLFLETFTAVRENFQRIFRQLFGGGRAEVSLEEGADVLEAGVEIVARPPGRELLPIGLLSGGQRTLTALALLFAVFEARPSPFCILDEVDAALDDANIERFLAMLDGYRASTQFIVVTHNKGTMAACQGLYGVTMETKGVSRQVQVELDEVDRWASPNGSKEAKVPPPEAPSAALDADTGEPVIEIVPQPPQEPAPETRARRTRAAATLASEASD